MSTIITIVLVQVLAKELDTSACVSHREIGDKLMEYKDEHGHGRVSYGILCAALGSYCCIALGSCSCTGELQRYWGATAVLGSYCCTPVVAHPTVRCPVVARDLVMVQFGFDCC